MITLEIWLSLSLPEICCYWLLIAAIIHLFGDFSKLVLKRLYSLSYVVIELSVPLSQRSISNMTEIFLNTWSQKEKAYFSSLCSAALGNSFNTKSGHYASSLTFTSWLLVPHRPTTGARRGSSQVFAEHYPSLRIHISPQLPQLYMRLFPRPYSPKKFPSQSPLL